jgi:4-amino-4-deoxy-L-arabinose transferase-like glycosyltransferase
MADQDLCSVERKRAFDVLVWAIMGIAFLVRFRGLAWDDGLMLHPDERNIVSAAMRVGPNQLVPDFHAYNGLAVYLPRLLTELLFAIGFLQGTGPADIAWSARLLSATASMATVVVMYRIANNVFDERSALLAAFLAVMAPALIQAAHFGTTESFLVLVISLLALVAVGHLMLRVGNPRAAVLYGLVLGIGLGFKTTAASFFILPIAAFLLRRNGETLASRLAWLTASGMLAFAILLLTTPQIIATPASYFATMKFENDVVRGTVDVFWTYQFHDTVKGLFQLKQLPWMLDPLSSLLIAPGILLLLWQSYSDRNSARLLLPLLLCSLCYTTIVFSWQAKFIRYLLPLMPMFILASVATFHAVGRRFGDAKALPLGITMALSVFLFGSQQAALYLRPDSRVEAWRYLVGNMAPRDTLLIEPVDVGPPFPGADKLAITVKPLPLIAPSGPHKLEDIADLLSAGQWMVISSRRHHMVLPGMHDRFPEICGYYAALWNGTLGYDVQKTFSRRGRGILSKLDPSDLAEETFSVFDSPRTFVLKNTKHLGMTEILRVLQSANGAC